MSSAALWVNNVDKIISLSYNTFFCKQNATIAMGCLVSEAVFEDRENLNEFLEEAELQQYYELFR